MLEALYNLEEDSSDLKPSQHSIRKRLLGDIGITLTELLPDLEHVALVGRWRSVLEPAVVSVLGSERTGKARP
jgi:hypothetical protein